ncbi:MAG: hypothetical protein ACLU6E_09090 [Dysosmobacter welbionis]|jgi:hypothetical protein|uniref:hypothetical protein n=1 Tax=Dysosmobacter welbionis TaxID=2093857 RepID=UPI00399B8C8F
MARPIDGDALKRWCEKIIDQACHPATVQIGEVFLEKVRSMPTLTLPNEPLTLEELREMGGQPYWHVGLREESPPPHWNILDPFYAKHIEDYRYGENWLAYRRPLEGEADA